MAQAIRSKGFELYYYDTKKLGELDFVIQNGMKTDLLEIKSGNDYKKHNAINKALSISNWDFGNVYVFCKGNIEVTESITYLPWYLIMFYENNQIKENTIFEIDLSGL